MAKPRYSITAQKVLTSQEQEHLLFICKRAIARDLDRNALMFIIGLECGLRASEIINLRIKDFCDESATIFVESLKGSNPRELPLRPGRASELKKFILEKFGARKIAEIDRKEMIFDISYQRLYQLWNLYRPNPQKTIHSLRHTFAINFYMKTKDIKAVQLALGHRNIDNTLVYVDFCYSRDELRRLMYG